MPAALREIGFRQEVNYITTHGSLPIQAIRLVEDDFVLLGRTIDLCGRANQRVDDIQVLVLTPFVVRDDDRRMRQLIGEGEKLNVPLPHWTTLRTERCANRFDSLISSAS